MSEFEIDGKSFDTEKLDDKQKRIIALYQKALKNEAETIADLELARASRIESKAGAIYSGKNTPFLW